MLVVDDQELVRSGLRLILDAQDDIEVVAEAADGATAVELARRLRPDVVLMDLGMPGIDGIEATRRITQRAEAPAVLVLTTFDLDRHVYDAMRVGATGFLTKTVGRSQLVEAVRGAARGETLLAPTTTRRLLEHFIAQPPPGPELPPAVAALTERELEVLRLVASGRSNWEIAAALFVGEATVKTHLNRLLAKLGLQNRTQAVVLAYETGVVRPGAGTAKPME
ncbi:response regulator transcription factor [Agrococcus beijingensis]|uniref:response regulator transcription factor n=1 Tax=Agrococcus beijingensis TaxID=3068634 RepID=UPI002741A163|nr:response regulator transcription factor [Agrococcus sp. REN33]